MSELRGKSQRKESPVEGFYVLQVEVNDTQGDVWTTWNPVAVITAETGARAIEQLAETPTKVGDGNVLVAVPIATVVARMTTIHQHAMVHEQSADLTALAPELREGAEEEAPEPVG